MLEHIVKNGEAIQDILNMYHIELDELMSYNLHITDFYNLASGMKIKIPLLHSEVEQILENTESFVQKYYPKVNDLFEEKKEILQPEIRLEEQPKEEKAEIPISPKPVQTPKGKPYPGILPPRYTKRG